MAEAIVERRIANYGNLEYGSDRSSNKSHYVRFTAKVHAAGDYFLSGGAVDATPSNQKQNLTVTRAPMRMSQDSVKLYLPAQISVSQKTNYGEAEMGGMIASGMAAMGAYQDGVGFGAGSDGLKAFIGESGTGFGDAAYRKLSSLAEGMGLTGAVALQNIQSGVTVNNRTEMMFEGIDRRSFAFTFRLIPHSAREAAEINKIVTSFRYHMLPEIPDGQEFGRALRAPSTYMINYAHERQLHKIGECILESVDVKYGGERPQFYHDNRPTETELTLQFKELEIMTKDKIKAGF
jgi:hypothetical protein|tara:strand:- start:277 stop:1152 length:876 start_codon:yes stop_codon:yes gene_type:complete